MAGVHVTPAQVRLLADRIRRDKRYGSIARATCAAILEGVAQQMERGEW